jgi:hypothetical protein
MPAANEVWLDLSVEETLDRIRNSFDIPPLKLKAVRTSDELPSTALEGRAEPKTMQYIDCGTARVMASKSKTITVPGAKSFLRFIQRVDGVEYSVWRSIHLGVVARFQVGPRPDARPGSSVRYQSTYFVTRERLVTREGQGPMLFRDAIHFSGDEAMAFPHGTTPCRSTGRFERELRAMLADVELHAPQAKPMQRTARHGHKNAPRSTTPAAGPKPSIAAGGKLL